MRRSAAIVLSGLLLAVAVTLCSSVAVSAQEEAPAATTTAPGSQGIVIKPNTGSAPTDAGDRGGALQSALFFVVVGGIGLIGFLVVRESRKARASREF